MTDGLSYHKTYYQENKEKWVGYNLKQSTERKDEIKTYFEAWKKDNPDKVKKYSSDHYLKKHEHYKKKHREYTADTKRTVLTHYGNGEMKCVLCGFDNPKALTIDHIFGGGNTHRKECGGSGGIKVYRWLIRNEFPSGFRTLCANCQLIEYYSKSNSPSGAQ
jgi:hypothetical protein